MSSESSPGLSDADRPLQFVPSFEEWCGESEGTIRKGLERLKGLGMGGIVLTVSLNEYLRNEHAWSVLRRGVLLAHDMGFRVWIYDEKGYPSGAAGGLVLQKMPGGEAEGLVRTLTPDGRPKYDVIRLYEATHATANFYEERRYINILDSAAVATFIDVTHAHYARVLDPLAEYVEAFFTDEPSLISAYVPQGRTYPPTLPWHSTLPGLFRKEKGYDLAPHLESLFRTTGAIDRKIRCDFYDVVTHLCAENYFGRIQDWCRAHHVQSSGHLLGEESLYWQTVFDGDPFPAYGRFDIPGIDMILSDPERILTDHFFIVPEVASSAARISGRKRVMCEISDFFGDMAGHPANVAQMCCTAGILFSLGVTDLVCMYPVPLKPYGEEQRMDPPSGPPFTDEEYHVYADCVTRLRGIFMRSTRTAEVAVVHPLRTIWAHFVPSHRSMYEPHPDPIVQSVDDEFIDLCRTLLMHGISFDVLDEATLAEARVEGGMLEAGHNAYAAVVIPAMDTARVNTMEVCERFSARGGSVFMHSRFPVYAADGPEYDARVAALSDQLKRRNPLASSFAETAGSLTPRLAHACALTPESPRILRSRLIADGVSSYVLVNVSSRSWQGAGTFHETGKATGLNPVNGETHESATENAGPDRVVHLSLAPFALEVITFR